MWKGLRGVVALAGKTLRRSYDRAEGRSPLHLVNAWSRRAAIGAGDKWAPVS